MEYLHNLLQSAVTLGASDIHLKPEHRVTFRVSGQLCDAALPVPSKDQVVEIVLGMLPAHAVERFDRTREADFSYCHNDCWRFRVNVFYQRGNLCLAMRQNLTILKPEPSMCCAACPTTHLFQSTGS